MVYLYALHCPIAKSVRYIGKTKNPDTRLEAHISKAKSFQTDHHCARWIRTVLVQGLEPSLEVLHCIQSGDDWQEAETKCIAEHLAAGHPLTNMTAGGDGFHDVHPDVLKRRGRSRSKTLSDPVKLAEFSSRLSAARANPAVRAAMSDGVRSAWADTVKRRRMMDGAKTDVARERKSAAMKKRNADPAYKERQSATLKSIWATPERRAQASARAIAMHADPEVRARRIASLKAAYQKPEVKARLAAAMVEARKRKRAAAQQSPEAA